MENVREIPKEFLEVGFVSITLIAAVGIMVALIAIPAAQVFGWDLMNLVFLIGVVAGLAMTAVVFFAIRYAITTLRDYFQHQLDMDTAEHQPREIIREIVKVEPAPALPPPAPPVITRGVKLINFEDGAFVDWQDVEYFARWIASGGSWSENTWKGRTLPLGYSMGSSLTYDRFIQLFVKAGIIVGRDAESRKTGTLAVKNIDEMLRLLDHAAPAKTTPPAPQ